jgi:hypothetical protein
MGQVVSLDEYRRRHDVGTAVIARLDRAVARLDPLVRERGGPLAITIQRELHQITGAISAGLAREAADRAERLIGLLAHPAASG